MRNFDIGDNLSFIIFMGIALLSIYLGASYEQEQEKPKVKKIIKTYTIEDGDTITIGTQIIDADE